MRSGKARVPTCWSGQGQASVSVRHYDDSRRRGCQCVRTWARGCCCPLYVETLMVYVARNIIATSIVHLLCIARSTTVEDTVASSTTSVASCPWLRLRLLLSSDGPRTPYRTLPSSSSADRGSTAPSAAAAAPRAVQTLRFHQRQLQLQQNESSQSPKSSRGRTKQRNNLGN